MCQSKAHCQKSKVDRFGQWDKDSVSFTNASPEAFSGAKAIAKRNNFAEKFPELAKDCDGTWDPTSFGAGSHKKVGWICAVCGHHFKMTIKYRCVYGSNCKECSIKKRTGLMVSRKLKKNSLAEKFPELAKECDGTWDPARFCAGSHKKVGWVCKYSGNSFEAIIKNRALRGQCCKDCGLKKQGAAYSKLSASKNNFAIKFPELAEECDGTWDPKEFSSGARDLLGWICKKCERHFKMSINSRTNPTRRRRDGSAYGCICGERECGGYKTSLPGYIYLLEKGSLRKYGITNYPEARVGYGHKRNGFDPIEILGPFCGMKVRKSESLIKATLKSKGVPSGRRAFRQKFDGWNETVNSEVIPANSIAGLFVILGLEVPAFLSS